MAFTQSDRDSVATALATGAKIVRFSDNRQVEYQSAADLLKVLATIDAELAALAAAPTPRFAVAAWPRW